MAGITSESGRPRPKRTEIIEDIRARIVSGEFAPGTQLPSLAKMQQMYGVADLTIRRAVRYLRDHDFIRTQHRSGMFVAEHPPCLCTIGVVMPYEHYKYRSQYFIAIENEVKHLAETEVSAQGLKRKFVFFKEIEGPLEDTESHHRELFRAVESDMVGGLIFAGPPVRFHKTAVLENPNVPCVGTIVFSMPGVISLSMDNARMMRKSLHILASRGRKRVALITVHGHDRSDMVDDQFVSLAAEYGMISHPWWVLGVAPSTPGWAENCTELLFRTRQHDGPDAVIIDDDNLVPHATAGIAAANVRIPDDVEVIAHTNFPWPTHSAVPATRIGLDVRKMIKTAVGLIESKRRGEDVPGSVTIESSLEGEATASNISHQPAKTESTATIRVGT